MTSALIVLLLVCHLLHFVLGWYARRESGQQRLEARRLGRRVDDLEDALGDIQDVLPD
jgi:hypothetical protein